MVILKYFLIKNTILKHIDDETKKISTMEEEIVNNFLNLHDNVSKL